MNDNNLVFSRLERDDIEKNKELFDFALSNDPEAVLEFVSNTENSKNINYLVKSDNEEVLLALYQNKNVSNDIQEAVSQKADTTQIILKELEKKPDQNRLNGFIEDSKESVLKFASKTKSETLMDMFPRNDDFVLALSKNENITPKISEKLLSYKSFNPEKQKEIINALSNNKALTREEKKSAKNQDKNSVLDNITRQFDPFQEETLREFKNSKDNVQNKITSVSDLISSFKKKQQNKVINKDKSKTLSQTITKAR